MRVLRHQTSVAIVEFLQLTTKETFFKNKFFNILSCYRGLRGSAASTRKALGIKVLDEAMKTEYFNLYLPQISIFLIIRPREEFNLRKMKQKNSLG